MSDRAEREGWDPRPWAMAALGAAAGLLIHSLTDGMTPASSDALRAAGAAFVAASATLFAFTFEPSRGRWAVAFALGAGAVVGLVIYWNGSPASWDASEGWRSVCVLLAAAIAAPLFQTARDEGSARFPYTVVHGHAWTNVVIWCAAWAFVGIVFALTFLLSALFELIGIDLLRDALREGWFGWMLGGTAFGGAIGLFRERDRIVGLLQRVVVSVLAVLAPVLGAGLLLFLLSLPFTGLAPLWEATKSTTPILLACVIGALILANAVIGNSDAEESRFAPLRFGAIALGLAMLPLALIAAVSTGLRIDQYGFTPDRLWALVFVIVATAYGLAYLVSLVRKRLDWAEAVRPANLKLAFGLCALALFLATPILSFNAISTRDQVARLESGRVNPEQFDWAALRFDFGAPGRAALDRLARSGSAEVKRHALAAQKLENRWEGFRLADAQETLATPIVVRPRQTPVPENLRRAAFGLSQNGQPISQRRVCVSEATERCIIFWQQGGGEAIVIQPGCWPGDVIDSETGKGKPICGVSSSVFRLSDGAWVDVEWEPFMAAPGEQQSQLDQARRQSDAAQRGDVEIRTVERRQLFIGGEPAGEPFE